MITGVGYNYRWAPLVRHAKHLIDSGQLGEITNYRGRFFTMYGADPMGLLSWRFLVDEAGHGVSSDILSHSVDLATMLIGPIATVSGTMETFVEQRPLAKPGGSHYDVGQPGDRATGVVTNEDYAAAMVLFANAPRHVRDVAVDHRPGVADGLRRVRHEGRTALEPGDDERAPGVPRRRRGPRPRG